MNISVIIPSYKNKELLINLLRYNLQFLKECEVIVVNDYPQESLKNDLREFKKVILIENTENKGFAGTINVGVNAAKHHYVMLLNSDVKLLDKSYEKALEHFEKNTNLFAVTMSQKEKDGTIVGKNRIFWQNGFIQHSKAKDLEFGKTAWAEGGSCVIDKKKFLELNGLDEIFSPFYWEDLDLSYRAWKSGWEVVFDPHILVEHHHESTIGKYFDQNRIQTIAYRNQFIFNWKNLTNPDLLFRHKMLLAKHLVYYLLKGNTPFIKGFFQALVKLPTILKNKYSTKWKLNDKEVLELFK
jgi:GT2 family glycosyltransferase